MNYICKCKKIDLTKKKYSYWENRSITTDEKGILDFLIKEEIKNKHILHIGIGDSTIAKTIFYKNKITGISISQNEIKLAKDLKIKDYSVHLCDKYSIDFKKICQKNKFDLIIDTNLKSYSCCQDSFNFMFFNMIDSLNLAGRLITSRNGMNWYKYLKPKISFNLKIFFHYKLKEVNADIKNKLTLKELKKLCFKNNIKFSFDKKMCYLQK